MRVLTVYLNGFRICSAGAGVDDNISACATMIGIGEDSSFLQVGGFDGANDYHLNWCFQQLKLGDEIRITVEEKQEFDQPKDRKSVEEMDQWARSIGKKNTPNEEPSDVGHRMPAPWE